MTPIAFSTLVPLSTWRVVEGQGSAKTDAMRAHGRWADAAFRVMALEHGGSEVQVPLP